MQRQQGTIGERFVEEGKKLNELLNNETRLHRTMVQRVLYFSIKTLITLSSIIFLMLSCKNDVEILQPPSLPPPPDQINTWDFIGFAGEDDISSIVVVPEKPWILYVGFSADFSAGTKGKILKSNNWGGNWKVVAESISVRSIVVDPQNDSIIYTGLNSANACIPGVIKSTNAGSSWFRTDSGMYLNWEMSVRPLIIDPTNSNVLYAGIVGFFGGGLLKTTNAGRSWFMLPPEWEGEFPPLAGGVGALAIDPKNPNILYAGTGGNEYLYKSYDAGRTFSVIYDTAVGLPAALEVNRFRTNVVYLGCRDGEFRRSTDHGATWQKAKSGLPFPDADRIIEYKDSVLFLCAGWYENGGVYQSNDDGITWKSIGINSDFINTIGIDMKNGFIYAADAKLSSAGIYRYKIAQ